MRAITARYTRAGSAAALACTTDGSAASTRRSNSALEGSGAPADGVADAASGGAPAPGEAADMGAAPGRGVAATTERALAIAQGP